MLFNELYTPAVALKTQEELILLFSHLRHCTLWSPHSQQSILKSSAGWSSHSWGWGSALWAPPGTTHSWNCQDSWILGSQGCGSYPSDQCRYLHMLLRGIGDRRWEWGHMNPYPKAKPGFGKPSSDCVWWLWFAYLWSTSPWSLCAWCWCQCETWAAWRNPLNVGSMAGCCHRAGK